MHVEDVNQINNPEVLLSCAKRYQPCIWGQKSQGKLLNEQG